MNKSAKCRNQLNQRSRQLLLSAPLIDADEMINNDFNLEWK